MIPLTMSAGDVTAPASASGTTPRTRDGSVTIASLIDAYMAGYSGRDSTRPQRLAFWRERLGHVKLSELDDDMIGDATTELEHRRGAFYAGRDVHGQPIMRAKRKPLSPATINRFQAAISAVLTWAQRQRITPKGWANPCRAVPMRRENNKRVRFLDANERARLLQACRQSHNRKLFAFVLLLLTSGCRRGEAEGLRWSDVDFERGEAHVARTKNGSARLLMLTPAVVEELRRHVAAPSSLVFSGRKPNKVQDFSHAWTVALRTAEIKNFRMHDCRHDAASSLAKAGASLHEIGTVLGHRQAQTTMRYAHLAVDHQRALVRRVMADVGAPT